MKNKLLIMIFAFFAALQMASAIDKMEEMVLDGSVPLITFGIDSTRNWWAITEPFANQVRVWINGEESKSFDEVKKLVFSPSGERYAYFAKHNGSWSVVNETETVPIGATEIGDIVFSRESENLVYSYKEANQEYIVINGNRVPVINKVDNSLFVNRRGNKYAYVSKNGSSYSININGRETQLFDTVKAVGFMNDDKFIYAAQIGNLWEIYSDDNTLTESYSYISEADINPAGNTAAFIAKLSNNYYITVTINNDYIEPLYSQQYDEITDLVIHPTDALVACNAMLNNGYFVLLNTTEYSAEEACDKPKFTYDGSELIYMTCRLNCYIGINGKRHKISGFVSPDIDFVKKPGDMSISYAGPNSILMQDIEGSDLYASIIIDRIATPIYNWKTNYYETVASIGNRLYLIGLRP